MEIKRHEENFNGASGELQIALVFSEMLQPTFFNYYVCGKALVRIKTSIIHIPYGW